MRWPKNWTSCILWESLILSSLVSLVMTVFEEPLCEACWLVYSYWRFLCCSSDAAIFAKTTSSDCHFCNAINISCPSVYRYNCNYISWLTNAAGPHLCIITTLHDRNNFIHFKCIEFCISFFHYLASECAMGLSNAMFP